MSSSSSSMMNRSHQQQHQSLLQDHSSSGHSYHQYFCMACCCPCLLMGNIRTKLSRESLLPCCRDCRYCSDCHIGKEGCSTCAVTCCLFLPCALPFSCYAIHERYKLKLFYPDDFRLFPIVTYKDWCYYLCCWPVNVMEQHAFVNTVNDEGFLTLQWEIDHYHSHVDINLSKTRTHIVLVFGSHSAAKIEFIRKFMMSIDRTTAFKSPYESVLPTTNSSKVSSKQQPEGVKDSMQSPKKGKSKPNLSIEMEEGSDQVSNASPSKDETASLIMLPSPTLSSPGKDISLFEKSSPDHTASVAPLSGIQEDNEENNEEMAAVSKYVDTTNKGWIKHEGTEKITAASADPRTALDTIHSWLRTLSLFDSPFLEFAEVWDIPPTQFNSYTVKTNLPSARVMLYIVDPSMEDQDIMSIKMQYSDNIKQLADHRQQQLDAGSAEADLVNAIHIVVILSSNIPSMQSQNQVEDRHYASRVADLLLWARRLGSLWFHVNIESEDDYYSFTKQLMILMKEK